MLNLFRRSGYAASRHDDDQSEKILFGQRERFAVAAIAFCACHDQTFRRRYIETICDKLPGVNVGLYVDTMTVEVEPHAWSDLLLTNEKAVVVVEHKIGASLQPHQDPDQEDRFLSAKGKPVGYGARMMAHHPSKYLGYVVLGKEFGTRTVGDRIHCSSVPWQGILPQSGKETPLEGDLFDCLGSFGVSSFNLRHIRHEIMNKAFVKEAAGSARLFEVLHEVCTTAGLKPGKISYGNDTLYSPGEFCFGLPFQKGRSDSLATKQGRLSKLVSPTGKDIGWFGYEKYVAPDWQPQPGEEGGITTVLLYCGDKKARQKTVAKSKPFDVRLSADPGSFVVRLVKPAKASQGDREWFLNVFETLTK